MSSIVIAVKIALAATLVMAGVAKLGTLTAFAGTVRQFLRPQWPQVPVRPAAAIIALAECAAGAASLLLPARREPDVLMALFCGGLLATAIAGYATRRGQPCHCFGGLGRGTFGWQTIARCALMVAAAGLVLRVPIESDRLLGLDGTTPLALTAVAIALTGVAVANAARILRFAREMR